MKPIATSTSDFADLMEKGGIYVDKAGSSHSIGSSIDPETRHPGVASAVEMRRMLKANILLIAILSVALSARCESVGGPDEAWMLQTNLLERVKMQPGRFDLPNVLILGDSISMGYTPFVKKRLSGTANVSRPRCNCGATQFYFRKRNGMNDWLGTNRWDVIVVNAGIWDICYMKGDVLKTDHFWRPDAELAKLPPLRRGTEIRKRGFRVRTPILEYAANLRKILSHLKSTGASVIFALTTPCPAYQYDDRCGLFRVYNEIASGVCGELDVDTLDLYSVGERNYDNQPDGAHYNDAGNSQMAEAVSGAVVSALAERRASAGKR